jgi:hypothetical protein
MSERIIYKRAQVTITDDHAKINGNVYKLDQIIGFDGRRGISQVINMAMLGLIITVIFSVSYSSIRDIGLSNLTIENHGLPSLFVGIVVMWLVSIAEKESNKRKISIIGQSDKKTDLGFETSVADLGMMKFALEAAKLPDGAAAAAFRAPAFSESYLYPGFDRKTFDHIVLLAEAIRRSAANI